MKKYIKPIVIACNIKAEEMICESLTVGDPGQTVGSGLVNDREDLVTEFDLDW